MSRTHGARAVSRSLRRAHHSPRLLSLAPYHRQAGPTFQSLLPALGQDELQQTTLDFRQGCRGCASLDRTLPWHYKNVSRDHLTILTGTWGDHHFSSSVHGQIRRLGLLSTVRHHSTSGGCPGSVAGGWRCRPWARRKGSTDRSMEFHIGVHRHHGIRRAPWPPNPSP
jgi:hypothetical protein